MSRPLVTLGLVTFQQVGLTMVRFGLPVLAPFVRADLGLTLVQVGVLLAMIDVGSLLMYVPLGVAADWWGERRVLIGGGLTVGLAALLAAAAPSYAIMLCALALAGVGFPSGHIGGSKVVTRYFPPTARGVAVGVRQSGLSLGGAAAALLVPVLVTAGGWRLALGALGGACVLCGLCCAALPRDEAPRAAVGSSLEALRTLIADRNFRYLTAASTALVVGQFTLQGYLPLYLVDEHGWAPPAAGRLLALVHVGGVAARLLWGAVSDRLAGGRRRPVLLLVAGGGVGVVLALVRLPQPVGAGVAATAALLAGMFLAGWNGLAVTMVLERAGAVRAATGLGLALTVIYVGTLVSSPLFGWVVDTTRAYAPAWLLVAACQAAAWGLLLAVREDPVQARPGSTASPVG
ncbi:MAG: MFS transporter [Firmicutes bacterium]|nr:MFS transporter [Bacillota bacterium]